MARWRSTSPVIFNVPPARIPGDSAEDRLNDLPSDAEALRVALLDAFDRQRQVDLAARLVAAHVPGFQGTGAV